MYVALYNTDNLLPLERGERERESPLGSQGNWIPHHISIPSNLRRALLLEPFCFGSPASHWAEVQRLQVEIISFLHPPQSPTFLLSRVSCCHVSLWKFSTFSLPPCKRLFCPARRVCARAYPLNGPEAGWQTFRQGLSLFTYRTQAPHHSHSLSSLLHLHRHRD